MNKNYEHFIIIRFSVKFNERYEFDKLKNTLFDEQRLDQRMFFFENFCFKSLINQSLIDFKIILLIDPLLPDKFKSKLYSLTKNYNFFIIHIWNSNDRLANNDWLKQYSTKEYLLTTRLDDDDIIHKDINLTLKNFINNNNISNNTIISFTKGNFIHVFNSSIEDYRIFDCNYKSPGIFLSYFSNSNNNIFLHEHDSINNKISKHYIKMKNCWGILNHNYNNDTRFKRFIKKSMKQISYNSIIKLFLNL